MPSTRLLADELSVSRSTAIAVYQQLDAEGLVVPEIGLGTRVTMALPQEFLTLGRLRDDRVRTPTAHRRIGSRATNLAAFSDSRVDGLPRPFTPGVPPIDQFPITSWVALETRHWRRAKLRDLCSPAAAGASKLRAAIATHLSAGRGVIATADDVLVVSGAQQALDLAAKVLADPGDVCWVEEPGYLGARYALQMAGLQIVPAVVDENGLDVKRAIASLPPPRLIYLTPSHQYPLGGTLPLERRLELLQYAERVGAWIIEDDYDSEFVYEGPSPSCLQGLDPTGRVVYIGSFNRTIFPSLRLGFVIAPEDLLQAFRSARSHADGHPPAIDQSVMADFLTNGAYASHLRRMRAICVDRRDALTTALAQYAPMLTLGPRHRGLHFVGYLPHATDDQAASARARTDGIIAPPLSTLYLGPGPLRGLLFGFACVSLSEIIPAAARLAQALKES